MVKIQSKEIRVQVCSWYNAGYINYKQMRKLVKMVKWYNKEPVGVSMWQGTLFGAWSFILLGIEKDGEAHS